MGDSWDRQSGGARHPCPSNGGGVPERGLAAECASKPGDPNRTESAGRRQELDYATSSDFGFSRDTRLAVQKLTTMPAPRMMMHVPVDATGSQGSVL